MISETASTQQLNKCSTFLGNDSKYDTYCCFFSLGTLVCRYLSFTFAIIYGNIIQRFVIFNCLLNFKVHPWKRFCIRGHYNNSYIFLNIECGILAYNVWPTTLFDIIYLEYLPEDNKNKLSEDGRYCCQIFSVNINAHL